MKIYLVILFVFFTTSLYSQIISESFELRYFTNDSLANGETDFKGKTQWFNTNQRIDFLKEYASVASIFFENSALNKKLINNHEIDSLLGILKPQPNTSIRKTILLNNWKSFGYRIGQKREKENNLKRWECIRGVSVENGILKMKNTKVNLQIDSLTWRFKVEASVKVESKTSFELRLLNEKKSAIVVGIKGNQLIFGSENKIFNINIPKNQDFLKLKVEVDLTQKKFSLYTDNKRLEYYIPIMDTSIVTLTNLSMVSKGTVLLDDIFIFNHTPTNEVRYPYVSSVVLDEDFQEKPNIYDWQNPEFNDRHWKEVKLPSVHGGVREKNEDYYLRKKIKVGNFQRAVLKLETLDPGGEVWVNGVVVGVVTNRHPVELDITENLISDSENIIAIKVNSYKLNNPMHHTPTDHSVGWFLGRASIELSNKCKITEVLVHTKTLGEEAVQEHKVSVQQLSRNYFEGSIEVNYYPWFPNEGKKVATISHRFSIPPRINNQYTMDCVIPSPKLWNTYSPSLYKVEVILRDTAGTAIDDFVTTTGIRIVEQKQGDFFVNGKTEMLNGAQIMGFRTPIETVSKYNRCAPKRIVAEELLMIKKMDANLLRIHVHAEKDTVDGINDPRYAELADQMGIMLIWQTAGFIREGEAWNVDFEGYPKFMKQVYNHPSIVLWEASNHPNKFQQHAISDTHNYIKKIYKTLYSTDKSRLISPTSFWQHTHYANSEGTLDYKGNEIKAVPEFTAHQVTRGSQDAYTGYGEEWTALRNAPNKWAASCLQDTNRAYFNFEHEESTAQPNWELCKGKPWYLLQSYEWGYDQGSIGRKLTTGEWRASQGWQAFSAWESMKKQMLLGYDGFSWCCLRGGANMGTYKKPLIDNLGHAKLAYYTNKMVFQRTWAGSNNVDVVYGPDDKIEPVIHHLGDNKNVDLLIQLLDLKGNILQEKKFEKIKLKGNRCIKRLEGFRFKKTFPGVYSIQYKILENEV